MTVAASPRAGRSTAVPAAVAIAAATVLRAGLGAPAPARSLPAALVFAVALLAIALGAGWRPGRPRLGGVTAGAAAAAVLLAFSLSRTGGITTLTVVAVTPALAGWMVVVTAVAASEEIAIRGALYTAVCARRGDAVAIAVCALLFALIHLPLYGAGALPLDLAVGVGLGGLRAAFGLSAAVSAHLLADAGAGALL